jgi:hypothetical protein
MWIGLLDRSCKPYHPRVVARVDADLVQWKLDYWQKGWLRLSNVTVLCFKVFEDVERPGFYGFFRDVDSAESFYAPVRFLSREVDTIVQIKAGDMFDMVPGTIAINLPMPKKR